MASETLLLSPIVYYCCLSPAGGTLHARKNVRGYVESSALHGSGDHVPTMLPLNIIMY